MHAAGEHGRRGTDCTGDQRENELYGLQEGCCTSSHTIPYPFSCQTAVARQVWTGVSILMGNLLGEKSESLSEQAFCGPVGGALSSGWKQEIQSPCTEMKAPSFGLDVKPRKSINP